MQSDRFAGYFMIATAVIVAVPVVFQLRAREADWKHVWSPVLFIVGLLATGSGYAFAAAQNQKVIAIAGVAAMLLGLIFAQKTTDTHNEG